MFVFYSVRPTILCLERWTCHRQQSQNLITWFKQTGFKKLLSFSLVHSLDSLWAVAQEICSLPWKSFTVHSSRHHLGAQHFSAHRPTWFADPELGIREHQFIREVWELSYCKQHSIRPCSQYRELSTTGTQYWFQLLETLPLKCFTTWENVWDMELLPWSVCTTFGKPEVVSQVLMERKGENSRIASTFPHYCQQVLTPKPDSLVIKHSAIVA